MVQYVFRDEPLTIKNAKKANPQKIGEALAQIAEAGKGHLLPKAVVNAARNDRSPLHRFFEWDQEVAAEAYRLDQARTLIRSIKIVDDDRDEPAPAFISIAGKGGTSYRSLSDVLSNSDLQLAALQSAERDLRSFEKRYQAMAEICAIVRAAREKIAERRTSLESREAAHVG